MDVPATFSDVSLVCGIVHPAPRIFRNTSSGGATARPISAGGGIPFQGRNRLVPGGLPMFGLILATSGVVLIIWLKS